MCHYGVCCFFFSLSNLNILDKVLERDKLLVNNLIVKYGLDDVRNYPLSKLKRSKAS